MDDTQSRYIPALGFRWLTRLYDPVLALLMGEARFKARLVAQAALEPGHRVLDLGCGTGTLTLMMAQAQPEAEVVGLDGDPEVLDIARRKATEAGVALCWSEGMVYEPPFEPGSFDRVVTSLVLHHLTTEHKAQTLASARSLLKPGGELHVVDWGRPSGPLMRAAFLGVQLLDGFETTSDNVKGRLPGLMSEAGFESVEVTGHRRTIFGSLRLYKAHA